MDALILAAGTGSRMGGIDSPKCLLNIGNTSIINYQINCFKKLGFEKIFVLTGYNSKQIKSHVDKDVILIPTSNYLTTNNLYSIWDARNFLQNDFICVYGDLFFHKQILSNCINNKNDICLVIEKNIRSETMRVKIENDHIVEVNKTIPLELSHGNFIGMSKFKKHIIPNFFNEISKLIKIGNHDAYYTKAIESMIKNKQKIDYVETNNLPWLDIDEKHEYEEAKKIYQNMNMRYF
jgi:L-glutamine-phosphate cytidylyltransferase